MGRGSGRRSGPDIGKRKAAKAKTRKQQAVSGLQSSTNTVKDNTNSQARTKDQSAPPDHLQEGDRELFGKFVIKVLEYAVLIAGLVVTLITSNTLSPYLPVIIFIIVGSLLLALWFDSHKLWRANPTRQKIARFSLATCSVFGLIFCAGWEYYLFNRPAPETEFEGELLPANDPNPPSPCDAFPPPNTFLLYYGNSLAWLKDQSSITVIKVGNSNLLSIDRGPKGIYVTSDIFGVDGKIIAELNKNRFHINRNNFFRRERPDRSTLIVYDGEKRQVLNIRYLNPSAVKILGIFHAPGHRPVSIEEEKQNLGGLTMSRYCSKNQPSDAVIYIR